MPGSNGRLETDSHADTCRAGNNCVVLEFDDDMGQSVLVQQEQNAIWREEQQLFNTTEETVSGGESVEESGINGATGWRC